jgi:hypothetical protein
MRSLAAYVMRGRIEAILVVAGLALLSLLLPLVSLLSTASLALVALRKGAKESAWVLAVSALLTGGVGALATGGVLRSVAYGLLLWVPVWPIALLLRTGGRLNLALEAAAALGGLGVAGVYWLTPDPAAMWKETLQGLVAPMLERAPPGFDAAMAERGIEFFSYMSGVAAFGSVTGLILGLLLARWQQAALFNPGGFRAEFLALSLHPRVVYAGLACLAAALAGSGKVAEFAWNLNAPFLALFLVSGFAILHALLAGKGFWLTGFYLGLLFIPQLLLPIALLGVTDVWLHWRARRPKMG